MTLANQRREVFTHPRNILAYLLFRYIIYEAVCTEGFIIPFCPLRNNHGEKLHNQYHEQGKWLFWLFSGAIAGLSIAGNELQQFISALPRLILFILLLQPYICIAEDAILALKSSRVVFSSIKLTRIIFSFIIHQRSSEAIAGLSGWERTYLMCNTSASPRFIFSVYLLADWSL